MDKVNYKLTKDTKEIEKYAQNSETLFIDTETTGLCPINNQLRLIQIKAPNKEFAIIIDAFQTKLFELNIEKTFGNKKLVFHNAKFDLSFLYHHVSKRLIECKIEDTMLIGKTFEPGESHSLKAMVKKHLNVEMEKTFQKSDWSGELRKDQLEYAVKDVMLLEKLYYSLKKKYDIEKNFIYRLEKAVIPVLIKTEEKGMKIDFNKSIEFLEEIREEYEITERILKEKHKINHKSPKEIAQTLMSQGIKLPKTKKGNYSTSEDVLKFIDHEIARKIIKLRKLKNSMDLLEAYITNCDENYRIHSTFNSWKTISGRMSSENPNLQNVPNNERFRSLFVADKGNVLLGADYPQIELRIAAKYTRDKTMSEALKNGIDLHKLIVAKTTGKKYKEITPEERKLGKPINFGLLYGMSSKTLKSYAKTIYGIDISEEEAKEFKRIYKKVYKGINDWQDRTIRKLKKNGYIETKTLGGRKAIAKRFTDALNYPIQGTGADIIKMACVYFEFFCKKYNINAQIINIIHDEIIVESKLQEKEKAKKLLKLSMEKAAERFLGDIPCPVEVKEGKSWAEIKD